MQQRMEAFIFRLAPLGAPQIRAVKKGYLAGNGIRVCPALTLLRSLA